MEEVERVKTKYNLPDKYILSLGKDEPRKNLESLIKACDGLPYPLVLTGKSGWGPRNHTPGSLGAHTPGVLVTGFIEDADLPALYSGAHVFVYPSLYEGFGFPVLEAMACGTPVVTSNISSLPEIVGDAGILVDPLSIEAIKQGIVRSDEQRDIIIKAGITRAQDFNWASTARQVLEVYEKIKNRN
jgi:glycosyltransferase involved in cell wall biosynthesis